MKKGLFITIYGINNIGKTTHAKRLVQKLTEAGHKAVYVKYPVYDIEPTGPFLNQVLRSARQQTVSEEELQLWFVLNRAQFQPTLEKWLSEGIIVVAEDYIGTGIAWGTAKGADQTWLTELNKFLIQEDFALFLDGERTMQAIEKTHIHETNNDLIYRCEKVLRSLAEKNKWHTIMIAPSKQETAEKVWSVIAPLLNPA